MLVFDVKDVHNEKVGSMSLDEGIFGAPVLPSLLHEVVQMQRASFRQGTAATKTKGLVRGGGKKPWRQKGTGRARAGSSRSPLWRGGGVTFGPVPRRYSYSFPKKKTRKALCSALSSMVEESALVILEGWAFADEKTRSMAHLLRRLGLRGRVLIAVSQKEDSLERIARNIPNVRILEIRQLDVYSLLCSDTLLMVQRDVSRLIEALGDG